MIDFDFDYVFTGKFSSQNKPEANAA